MFVLATNLTQQEQVSRSKQSVFMFVTFSCFGILHVYACLGILLWPRVIIVLWPKLVSTQGSKFFTDLCLLECRHISVILHSLFSSLFVQAGDWQWEMNNPDTTFAHRDFTRWNTPFFCFCPFPFQIALWCPFPIPVWSKIQGRWWCKPADVAPIPWVNWLLACRIFFGVTHQWDLISETSLLFTDWRCWALEGFKLL